MSDMNVSKSLRQYIELFTEQQAGINKNSPGFINDRRNAALAALQKIKRLPERDDEGYEKTSLESVFAPDLGVNVDRLLFEPDLAATFNCNVPKVSTLVGLVINDVYRPTANLLRNLPHGVHLMSLSQAARDLPDITSRFLGSIAARCDSGADAPTALNDLLLQDGVLLYVEKGVQLDKALQLVNIFNAPVPMLAIRRLLVVMEPDSRACLLVCDHSQRDDINYTSLQVTELSLAPGARFDLYEIEESGSHCSRVSRIYACQSDNTCLTCNTTTLSCGVTRNDLTVDIDGDNCETRLAGMVTGLDNMHADYSTLVRHRGQHCHSSQQYKYVLTDKAQGAFEGLIVVDKDAQFTDATQNNRNLLASPQARMHTRPQLEIYCDDVKCSHGATTGQLDEQALFYMRSRGIPEPEARMMLMQAFMADVLDTIELEGLRDRLRHLVERRLSGAEDFCNDCGTKGDVSGPM